MKAYLSKLRRLSLPICIVGIRLYADIQTALAASSDSAIASYQRPGTAEVGGIRQMCLIYHGNRRRLEWTPEMILPYVAHVDEQGRPTDLRNGF